MFGMARILHPQKNSVVALFANTKLAIPNLKDSISSVIKREAVELLLPIA